MPKMTYTVTCGSCDRAFESPEPYASPHVRPLCPTCDALARMPVYTSPGERQAAALEQLVVIGERIAAALEAIAEIVVLSTPARPSYPSNAASPYDAGRKR